MILKHMASAAATVAVAISLAACGSSAPPTPANDGNAAPVNASAGAGHEVASNDGDALVRGTKYHATAQIECSFGGAAAQSCAAGVVRHWGEDGTNLVEVQKPDGFTRALFFEETKALSADSAEADGSAGFDFVVTRRDDNSVIDFGPEHYVIPDALITGG